MPRGTTLSLALQMLKSQIGMSISGSAGSGSHDELYHLIESTQRWLATEFDWPFLRQRADVSITAGTGDATRYPTAPTTINFERPVAVSALYSERWHPVELGIGMDQYNALSSGDGSVTAVQLDPIARWDWKMGDPTKIEIWPLPVTDTTLRFDGQRALTSLRSGGSFNLTATLDLDDELIVLFAAAKKLSRSKKEDHRMVLAQAESRLNRLRAAIPSRVDPIKLGGYVERRERRTLPIITVAS